MRHNNGERGYFFANHILGRNFQSKLISKTSVILGQRSCVRSEIRRLRWRITRYRTIHHFSRHFLAHHKAPRAPIYISTRDLSEIHQESTTHELYILSLQLPHNICIQQKKLTEATAREGFLITIQNLLHTHPTNVYCKRKLERTP